MPDVKSDEMIHHRFTVKDADTGHEYTDALNMTVGEWRKLSTAQVVALEQERFAAWKQALADAQNAPPPPPPTVEELQAQLQAVQDQAAVLQQQINDVAAPAADDIVRQMDERVRGETGK